MEPELHPESLRRGWSLLEYWTLLNPTGELVTRQQTTGTKPELSPQHCTVTCVGQLEFLRGRDSDNTPLTPLTAHQPIDILDIIITIQAGSSR